jgi:hypothetical protein
LDVSNLLQTVGGLSLARSAGPSSKRKQSKRKKNPPKKKTLWFLIIPEANNPVVFGAPCSPVYIAALVFDSLNSARH